MFAEPPLFYRLPAWIFSLKGRVLGFFSLFFLISGWIIASYAFFTLQEDLHKLLSRQQYAFVSQLVEEIEQKITLQRDALARVAQLMTPDMLASPDYLAAFLANRAGVRGFFTGGLVVIDQQGMGIAEFPALGRVGQIYAERDFFRDMLKSGQSVVSEPYFSLHLQEPVVTMIAPVLDRDGRVIAGLMGAIRLTQPNFLGRITGYQPGEGTGEESSEGGSRERGGLFIVSPRSRIIIVSTDKSRIFTPVPGAGLNPMLDRYMDGYEGSNVAVNAQGVEELTSGRRLPGTGWVLIARLPTAEAFQPIYEMKARLLIAMLIFATVSLGALWLILWRSLHPLTEATTDIRDMVNGHRTFSPLRDNTLRHNPVRHDAPQNEVHALLTAFNALHTKLAASEEELEQSQNALRRSESFYRHLFEGCRAVELLIEPDSGRIVDANTAAAAYYGWSRETLRNMTISQINTLDPAMIAAEMQQARSEKRDHFRFQHRRANGDIRDVEVWSGPVYVDNQELLYSIIIDVTERWRAEREVRQLLDFRRAILDAAGNAIIATDAQGIIRLFNPTAERWLGYRADEVVGRHTPALFHDPDELAAYTATPQPADDMAPPDPPAMISNAIWGLVRQAIATGQPDIHEWNYVRKDGQRFPVLLTVTTLRDENDRIWGFLGVAQDIAPQKRLEQDLKRSNSDLEHFAYVASHDLRQPLRQLSNYIGLLERKLKDYPDEKIHGYIAYALDGARRMDTMIVDLLEYSRIGRITQASQPVSLNDVLDIVRNNLSDTINTTKASIAVTGPLPIIYGCSTELIRLFQNLLDNALKFHVENQPPHIHISASIDHEGITVAVRDNGIGIDAKDLDRLFQIFQRLDNDGRYPGTGIGLAACRKIVEHMGGRIRVESRAGEGCTFFIMFPHAVIEEQRA